MTVKDARYIQYTYIKKEVTVLRKTCKKAKSIRYVNLRHIYISSNIEVNFTYSAWTVIRFSLTNITKNSAFPK